MLPPAVNRLGNPWKWDAAEATIYRPLTATAHAFALRSHQG